MRSRRPAEAFAVKSSGGSQQRSTWQSAEIISYRIARERSSAELARQAAAGTRPRGRRAGSGCGRYGAGDRARAAAGVRRGARRLVVVPSADLAPDLAARGEVRVGPPVAGARGRTPSKMAEGELRFRKNP